MKRTELADVTSKKDFVARTLLLLYLNRVGEQLGDSEEDVFEPVKAADFQTPNNKLIVDSLISKNLVEISKGNLSLTKSGLDEVAKIVADGEKFQRVYGPFEAVQLGDYSFDCEFLLDAEDWDHYLELEEQYYANMNLEGYTGDDLRFAVANYKGVDVLPLGVMLKFHVDNHQYDGSKEIAKYLEDIEPICCYDIETTINYARRWEEMGGVNIDDPEFPSITQAQLDVASKAMEKLIKSGLDLSKKLDKHRTELEEEAIRAYEEENGDDEYDDDEEGVVVTTTTTTYVDDPYLYYSDPVYYYDPFVPLLWCAILF